jgi:hypothetical protein
VWKPLALGLPLSMKAGNGSFEEKKYIRGEGGKFEEDCVN